MPRNDGTGPMGNGPKTGRGLGNCPTGESTPSERSFNGPGKGLGNCTNGRRSGRGCGKGNGNGNGNGFGRGLNRGVDNQQDANQR